MQHTKNAESAEDYAARCARRISMIREVIEKGRNDPDQWRVILTAFFLMHMREKKRIWMGPKFVSNLRLLAIAFERRVNLYQAISFVLRADGPTDEWEKICRDITLPTPDPSWAIPVRELADEIGIRLKASDEGVESTRIPVLEAIGMISVVQQ